MASSNIEDKDKYLRTYTSEKNKAPKEHTAEEAYVYLNGHDLTSILSVLTDSSKHPFLRTHIEKKWFKTNFTIADFKKTKLYEEISKSAYAACLKN